MQVQTLKLSNSLRLIFIDTKTFPSLTALLLVGAGSRYEDRANNGIAHFFEHMVFKGSRKYPDTMAISSLLDSLGSEHNAFTSKDHTGYWIKAPTKHFAVLIDILSDVILHPLLKPEEIEREKGVIVEEINMYEDTPQYKVWDLFESLVYPNHPLGLDTTGTKQSVTKFNRQTFTDYMQGHYYPANAVLVIAGGLNQISKIKNQNDKATIKNYQDIINDKFNLWQPGKAKSFIKFQDKQAKPATLIIKKKTEQAHLVLGYKGLDRFHKDRYVQAVLMAILGGGMSSRLFYQVRERRGLCYYIQSGTETFAETGYVYTRAGLNSDRDRLKEAIRVIDDEHQKVAGGDVSEKELDKAKEMLKGRLLLSLEDSNNLALFYGRKLMLEGRVESPEAVINQIDRVTKAQVEALAKQLFVKNKMNLAVIGPFKEEDFKLT